ncbi:MAG: hypothetical protein JJV92_04750 [Desulfosarcina sp.]|nr:hypothetical protein [Desulfobacterales bacterium]
MALNVVSNAGPLMVFSKLNILHLLKELYGRTEAQKSYSRVDIVFEKNGKRLLETFPQNLLMPVADTFQRYQNNESDHPTDFF